MRAWLKELRKSKSFSMKDVASRANISESYYCLIEAGDRGCPVPTAKKIAEVLGFDWQRFYEEG